MKGHILIYSYVVIVNLAAPFDLSVPSAKPINMPPTTWEFDPPAGIVATVSGWGTTSVRFSFLRYTANHFNLMSIFVKSLVVVFPMCS